MSFIDNIWTIKILGMLVTPFNETKAFQLGIIDENGSPLKKISDLRSSEEKSAYDMLDRFVFSIKKIINRLPGGESKLKNITAAYFLVKENRMNLMEECEYIDVESVTNEQMLYVASMLEDIGSIGTGGGVPANVTGQNVSTDEPKIYPKGKKDKSYKFVKRNTNKKL